MIGLYDINRIDLSDKGGTIPFIDGTNVDNVVMCEIRTKDDAEAIRAGIRDQITYGLCFRGAQMVSGVGKTFTAVGNYAAIKFTDDSGAQTDLFLDLSTMGPDFDASLLKDGTSLNGRAALHEFHLKPVDMIATPEPESIPGMS